MREGKAKIRQPVEKGTAKVPVIIQMEALECGAACLAMVAAYYEKWVPLEQVRVDCGVSRDGSNAKNILLAGRNYGFNVNGYMMGIDTVMENATYPCIIHWNFDHFVVLCGFRRGKAVLNDPARGHVQVSMEEFDKSFTGICLLFEPGEEFVPSGRRKSTLAFAKKRLQGAGPAVAFVMLTSIIAYLFGIISSPGPRPSIRCGSTARWRSSATRPTCGRSCAFPWISSHSAWRAISCSGRIPMPPLPEPWSRLWRRWPLTAS